jgi:hypothetical protein
MRVRMLPSVMWCVNGKKKKKEKSSLYEKVNAWRDEMRRTDSCAVKYFLLY